MNSQNKANINIINANAYQNITIFNAQESSNIIKEQFENYKNIYKSVADDLNFDSKQLVNYIKYEIMGNSKMYLSL